MTISIITVGRNFPEKGLIKKILSLWTKKTTVFFNKTYKTLWLKRINNTYYKIEPNIIYFHPLFPRIVLMYFLVATTSSITVSVSAYIIGQLHQFFAVRIEISFWTGVGAKCTGYAVVGTLAAFWARLVRVLNNAIHVTTGNIKNIMVLSYTSSDQAVMVRSMSRPTHPWEFCLQ